MYLQKKLFEKYLMVYKYLIELFNDIIVYIPNFGWNYDISEYIAKPQNTPSECTHMKSGQTN